MMNLETAINRIEELEMEVSLLTEELAKQEQPADERVAELEAKVKELTGKLGQSTKKLNAATKAAGEEAAKEIDALKTIIASQEDLIHSQQEAVTELQQRCEDAYDAHNDMVRKLDAVQLILGK